MAKRSVNEFNYDQNPKFDADDMSHKPKRGISNSKPRSMSSRIGLIVNGVVLFIMIAALALLVLISIRKLSQKTNMDALAADINAGHVEKIVVDGDTLNIYYNDGDEATVRLPENAESPSWALYDHGADIEALADLNISYNDTPRNTIFNFILLYVVNFVFVVLILFQLPKRVENKLARIGWVAFILYIPILGPVVFLLSTKPNDKAPHFTDFVDKPIRRS